MRAFIVCAIAVLAGCEELEGLPEIVVDPSTGDVRILLPDDEVAGLDPVFLEIHAPCDGLFDVDLDAVVTDGDGPDDILAVTASIEGPDGPVLDRVRLRATDDPERYTASVSLFDTSVSCGDDLEAVFRVRDRAGNIVEEAVSVR